MCVSSPSLCYLHKGDSLFSMRFDIERNNHASHGSHQERSRVRAGVSSMLELQGKTDN